MLAVACALAVYLAWRTGITIDEPGHLVGARLYWEASDRLKPGDMPPLIKIAGGWVVYQFDLPLAPDLGNPGDTRREWEVATTMIEAIPADELQRLFFFSRLTMIAFLLLAGWIVWLWARRLFSPVLALAAAGLFLFEPTALAHSALFKNDIAATFAYLLFWYAAWRYWQSLEWRNAALLALAAALAMIAKLSLLYVFGLAPLIVLVRTRPLRRALTVAAAVCLTIYILVLCAAQFEVLRLGTMDLARLDADRTLPAWFAPVSRLFTVIPVPARMWEGTVSIMSGFAYENPVYFWGEVRRRGHPLYFLGALAVKAPEFLLVFGITGALLATIALLRRRLNASAVLWLLPGPLYIVLASRVPVQLGVRLILPALPFGILAAVYALDQLKTYRSARMIASMLAALFVFETSSIYPNGIAFFNTASGGPRAGFRYLADSNLDWGQGLGELRRWLDRHPGAKLRVSYFGMDQLRRYFKPGEIEPLTPPWADKWTKGKTRIEPEADWFYAISPNVLPGHFFAPKYHDYYSAFRAMAPVARPGYSMFVYRAASRSAPASP